MISLSEWERGFSLAPDQRPDLRMYLWFYEWHLFDAFEPGLHTGGRHRPARELAADARSGRLAHDGLDLQVTAGEHGAHLELTVTNVSDHAWPEIAAIIPCFNPGQAPTVAPTEAWFDDGHERTWFLGRDGLEPLVGRHIHFHRHHRQQVLAQTPAGGQLPFSDKWPTSDLDAGGGLLLRETVDGEWVAAIAWEDALSLQGHNPWRCMHQSIRVGPLAPGASRRIRGAVYVMQATRDNVLRRFRGEFG